VDGRKNVRPVRVPMPFVPKVPFWNRWKKRASGATSQQMFTWKAAIKTEMVELVLPVMSMEK